MSRDLRRWLAACLCCQRRKPSRNKKYGLTSPMARASKPFATLHIDLVGPFDETTSGFAYILTAMCPFTQFPFAVPLPNKEADTVAKALNKEVFSLVGSPERLVSDRAPEFIGEVMQGVNKLLRIKHVRSSGAINRKETKSSDFIVFWWRRSAFTVTSTVVRGTRRFRRFCLPFGQA